MYFNLRKPYISSILSSFLVTYQRRRLYMESPQTVPKDTLPKQNTPSSLSIIVFKALSYQNGIEVPSTKRKCLKSSYLTSFVLRVQKLFKSQERTTLGYISPHKRMEQLRYIESSYIQYIYYIQENRFIIGFIAPKIGSYIRVSANRTYFKNNHYTPPWKKVHIPGR